MTYYVSSGTLNLTKLKLISGTEFYGSNDPINSVNAPKEHIEVNQIEQNTTIHLNYGIKQVTGGKRVAKSKAT